MPNRTYALEWLRFAQKNFDTAILLFEANHYEDIIGIELQQTLEKLFKALFAYNNTKIPKDHDLVKLYFMMEEQIGFLDEDSIMLLRIATDYYKEDRYPNPSYTLPPKEEIEQVLKITHLLFDTITKKMQINIKDIKEISNEA